MSMIWKDKQTDGQTDRLSLAALEVMGLVPDVTVVGIARERKFSQLSV